MRALVLLALFALVYLAAAQKAYDEEMSDWCWPWDGDCKGEFIMQNMDKNVKTDGPAATPETLKKIEDKVNAIQNTLGNPLIRTLAGGSAGDIYAFSNMIKDDLQKGKLTEEQAAARLEALNKRTETATQGIAQQGQNIQKGLDKGIDIAKEVGKFGITTACTAGTGGAAAAACRVAGSAIMDSYVDGVRAIRDGKQFDAAGSIVNGVVNNIGAAAPVKLPAGTGALAALTKEEAKKYVIDGAKKIIWNNVKDPLKEFANKQFQNVAKEVLSGFTRKSLDDPKKYMKDINIPEPLKRILGNTAKSLWENKDKDKWNWKNMVKTAVKSVTKDIVKETPKGYKTIVKDALASLKKDGAKNGIKTLVKSLTKPSVVRRIIKQVTSKQPKVISDLLGKTAYNAMKQKGAKMPWKDIAKNALKFVTNEAKKPSALRKLVEQVTSKKGKPTQAVAKALVKEFTKKSGKPSIANFAKNVIKEMKKPSAAPKSSSAPKASAPSPKRGKRDNVDLADVITLMQLL